MPKQYKHRNGETEPPTIEADFRFSGEVSSRWLGVGPQFCDQRGTLIHHARLGWQVLFEGRIHARLLISQCVGQWWGPLPAIEQKTIARQLQAGDNRFRDRRVPTTADAWARRKAIYELHRTGKTYALIGRELGLSKSRVAQMGKDWAFILENYDRSPRLTRRYNGLVAAGLIPRRSLVYGYA